MADDSTINRALWDRLKAVDRAFTKPITGKAYKGDSPNPQWMVMKATEALGPIGQDWGFTVISERIQEGKPIAARDTEDHWGPPAEAGGQPVLLKRISRTVYHRELYHYVHIRFWQKAADGRMKGEYDAFGGTPMLIYTSKGSWIMDEDASKKSLTDAMTKGLSWLGVAADLFLGIFDDKYQAPLNREPVDVTPAPAQLPPPSDPTAGVNGTPAATAPAPKETKPQERQTTTPSGW